MVTVPVWVAVVVVVVIGPVGAGGAASEYATPIGPGSKPDARGVEEHARRHP